MANSKFVYMLTLAVLSNIIYLPELSNVSGQTTIGGREVLNNQLNQTSPLSSENQTQINGSAGASVDAGIGVPGFATTN